jgi:hypothetical protein
MRVGVESSFPGLESQGGPISQHKTFITTAPPSFQSLFSLNNQSIILLASPFSQSPALPLAPSGLSLIRHLAFPLYVRCDKSLLGVFPSLTVNRPPATDSQSIHVYYVCTSANLAFEHKHPSHFIPHPHISRTYSNMWLVCLYYFPLPVPLC